MFCTMLLYRVSCIMVYLYAHFGVILNQSWGTLMHEMTP
jgi:hypothetical protein